jgi:outer membrane scaffolding protein for murein synthesis (MipA/OmpV family)
MQITPLRLTALLMACCTAAPALAQSTPTAPRAGARPADVDINNSPSQLATAGNGGDWDINVGAGFMMRPTFAGSDRYRGVPLPIFTARWRNTLAFGENGLTATYHDGPFRIGVGATFDGGREDNGGGSGGGLFDGGDDRLNGLGKIDWAIGLRGFTGYRYKFLDFNASFTKFLGDQNDGMQAQIGVSAPMRLYDDLILIPNLRANWANQKYTQLFFGVTPLQASRSMFPVFNASSGLTDVGVGVNLIYRFDNNWFAAVNASGSRMMDSASDSPISITDYSATTLGVIGYHF